MGFHGLYDYKLHGVLVVPTGTKYPMGSRGNQVGNRENPRIFKWGVPIMDMGKTGGFPLEGFLYRNGDKMIMSSHQRTLKD